MRHPVTHRSASRRPHHTRVAPLSRSRSGVQTAAAKAWSFASAFPDPRLDRPRGHLDWRFAVSEPRPSHFEVTALDPRTGQEAGSVYYELSKRPAKKRVLVTLLEVNGRYRQTDCLLALLAHPRRHLERGFRLESRGLEEGSRLERLYQSQLARERARRRHAWRHPLRAVARAIRRGLG